MSVLIVEQDVVAAMNGDSSAFTRLIQASKNTISSIALAVVKDLDASEEVAQQVYIQCWQKLNTLNNPASFLPWIRQATRYAAFNYLRDNKVADRVGGDDADSLFARFCNESDDGETSLSRSQQAAILARIVDDLPEETREIVLLYYREEQSSAQVARLLSITDAAVRQQLSRARQALRTNLLDKYGNMILSTAPTLAIGSALLASTTISTPAQAATGAVAKGGFLGVVKWLLSGAMFAAFVGAIAVYFSAEIPIRRMQSSERKAELRKLRGRSVVAILITGGLLAAAYELTTGWIAPIVAYEILMAIVFVQTRKMQDIIAIEQCEKQVQGKLIFGLCAGRIGLYAGILFGNVALLYGLYASGRAFWG
ncbi:RNA polymerase sigma factor [Neptunicella marina]|uniref:Sigma-70 family RNA polymerase sigma factor n=1 Tax=Neptunicella marina TaxID=2125989 RepID=A0A8J6IRL5_9ALTE|nr:sigma-70 family RNA polymerase sigma factor [Neptunicella marina]MBC3766210.1 sigma-70 family RNA polymerase sigma factor [Neptunicella marina]